MMPRQPSPRVTHAMITTLEMATIAIRVGAPSTLPGYGPNTRTVMKIVVAPEDPAVTSL